MADHIAFLGPRRRRRYSTAYDHSLASIRRAVAHVDASIEVKVVDDEATAPVSESAPRSSYVTRTELMRTALGIVIVTANGISINEALDACTAFSGRVPVFEITDDDQKAIIVDRAPGIATGERARFKDLKLVDRLVEWLGSIAHAATEQIGTETGITVSEHRAIEVFLTAFYRAIETDELCFGDADGRDALILADTVNLQLRSSKPNRRVLQAAIGALSGFLAGVMSGAAGNYLYNLLPHVK